jgi:hypothetical protein
MSALPVEIIKMFKEYNTDESKVHLKQLLEVGYEGFIPSCVILNKTLPGLGATTCEIESKRCSIIIEPNVPVIDGKAKKYPNERWPHLILGVRKGVKQITIESYLNNPNIPFKKILTTPESFIHKVLPAFKKLNITDYQSNYFLLLDESEKFIQDTDFREALFRVMKKFWKFENKALVSATPIIPNDRAYQEQGFKVLQVQPSFNYEKELTVMFTNSVLNAVKEVYNEECNTDKVCFFINSVTMIDNVIKHLGLEKEARIYCGEDSIPRIKDLGYEDYDTIINHINGLADLKRVNFFTSRFFSAVDIDLVDDNVSVIMVTDNYVAPHSVLDPYTHIKQIIGRFRKDTRFNCHIFNTREDVAYRSKEEVLSFTRGSYSAFKAVHTLYLNEQEPMVKQALKEALNQLKFKDYTYPYNNKLAINWLLIDNEIEDEKVKELYTHPSKLQKAFHEDPFYTAFTRSKIYLNDDKLKYQISKIDLRTLRACMVNIHYKIWNSELNGPLSEYFSEYELHKEDGYILGVAQYLEREDLERYDYNPKILDPILEILLEQSVKTNWRFRNAIRTNFKKGVVYSRSAIRVRLEELFTDFNISDTITATRLSDYCVIEKVNVGVNGIKMPGEIRPKGYVIIDYLFSILE